MTNEPPIIPPDEVSDYYGLPSARFGQTVHSYDEPSDPVPAVYVSGHGGGEVQTGEYRGDLDEAEQYAARILNAVRWQRARNAEKRAAELNEMATGDAATHDWWPSNGSAKCRGCRTVAYGDELLVAGVVPTCGTRCPKTWHEIVSTIGAEHGDAKCIFCDATWSAERLYVFRDARGRSLAWGPYLTLDQALPLVDVDRRFVPMPLRRDEALAAVAERKRIEAAGPQRGHCETCEWPVCAVGAEDPCSGCCACLDRCVDAGTREGAPT